MAEHNSPHNPHNTPRSPGSIDPAMITPAAMSPGAEAQQSQGNGLSTPTLIAGAILLLILMGVFFLLPQWVEESRPSTPAPSASTAPALPPSATSLPATGTTAPASDNSAELAQLRRQAQDVLAQIRSAQQALENRNVQSWARAAFDSALAQVVEGDNSYRKGAFAQSLDSYQQALTQFQGLLTRADTVLAEALAAGQQALESGDESAAIQAFELALSIDANHAEAAEGLKRARLLPQTGPLLATARQQFADQQFSASQDTLNKLLTIDPPHPQARALLEQVKTARAQQAYNSAMAQGLLALEASDPDSAITYFQKALKAKPDDNDAATLLAQASSQRQSRAVAATLKQAATLEQQEQWQGAVAAYQQVLDKDDSLVAARVGLLRAQTRARLAQQIETLLNDPLRLAAGSVQADASRLLEDARQINPAGPVLQDQIRRLEQTLVQAQTPVDIQLESDGNTLVTLLRIGELGQFTRHTQALRPGRYVALGIRPGYRDVRVEFTVQAGGMAAPVLIICREPI